MSYMWHDFNIKTFPAETIVFRDGMFCPELSTIENGEINKKYEKPVHIIYIGEISGDNDLNVIINVENQPVFISVNINNKKPAFFNIFIKNAGKNSSVRGHIMLNNFDNLTYKCNAHHVAENTEILIKTKIVAERNSLSDLSGAAIIDKNCPGTVSDISLAALADKGARIKFMPAQHISSVPDNAGHSASIYQPTAPQIEYLRSGGLSGAEVEIALREAFMNDFGLF